MKWHGWKKTICEGEVVKGPWGTEPKDYSPRDIRFLCNEKKDELLAELEYLYGSAAKIPTQKFHDVDEIIFMFEDLITK